MREDIAKIWVKELRSGKYKQGGDYLCRDDKYCCLGVLCDIFKKTVKTPEFSRSKTSAGGSEITYFGGNFDVLPVEVMEWAGILTPSGTYSDTGYTHSLSELNDGGHSFDELADIIEAEYHQL